MEKSLDLLRPEFRGRVARFLHVVTEDLGIDVRVHETFRSFERQEEVLAAGASKNKIGWHNFGLAIDIGCYLNGVYQQDDKSGLYLKVGFVGMAFGFRWGGNWDQDRNIAEPGEADLGHFEYHPGFTLQQFMASEPNGGLAT